ncbi:MAG: SOS response-associated peptidase [Firmicutes bacterium]|nr:SOS response-associated peptidase [Bacillota bacterium]
MCGRFALVEPLPEVAALFAFPLGDVAAGGEGRRVYNIAPQAPILAVVWEGGRRRGAWLRWGLVPAWAEDAGAGARMFNARAETASTRPAFRQAFARRRCLVPATAFYEWERRAGGPPQAHAYRGADGRPLALAGIWEENRRALPGVVLRTASILTVPASPPVAAVHDRMPLVLPPERWEAWLRPDTEAERVKGLLAAEDGVALVDVRVGSRVNSPRHDDPSCLEPAPA